MERAGRMKRLFNKDVPFITYIIHDKNMKNGRTVTVYKPTQEYYILFELIKFRRLPSTFPDIGITVISEGLEPSPSDVSVTQDVTTPEPASRDALTARIAKLEAEQRWIPVSERPLESGTFFVLLKNGEVTKDWTFIDGGRYYWWNHGANITHWMPLPTPPEVQE